MMLLMMQLYFVSTVTQSVINCITSVVEVNVKVNVNWMSVDVTWYMQGNRK